MVVECLVVIEMVWQKRSGSKHYIYSYTLSTLDTAAQAEQAQPRQHSRPAGHMHAVNKSRPAH